MYTIKQIIDNQRLFRNQILQWLTFDLREAKNNLKSIDSEDEYIQSQVDKLKNKFKKTKYKKEVNRLFFMHPKRNEEFYIWWDEKEQEAIILSYGKK